MIRPIPVVSNLAAVLKRIKAGDRLEAIMQHCSAATDLLRKKIGQWADAKNKESPSYRKRSAVFPIHNLARDMNNGTIWTNKERLMLLECLYGVHPVEPDELLMPGGREFAICSQAQTLLDVMPERKNWPIAVPVEGTQEAFTRAYAKNAMWEDKRRWQLWYFMVRYLEERV